MQTPKNLTSQTSTERAPSITTGKKADPYGQDFFLQHTFELLDRGNSEAVQFHKDFQNRTGLRAKEGMFVPMELAFGRSWKRDLSTISTPLVQTDVDADIRPSFGLSGRE